MQIHLDACAREKSSREPLETSFHKPLPFQAYFIDMHHLRSIRAPSSLEGEGVPRPRWLRPLKKKVICPLGGHRLQSVFHGTFVPRKTGRERATCAPLSTWRCIRLADFSRAKHRARTLAVHVGRFSSYQGMFGELEDGRRGRCGYHRGAKSLAYAFCTLKSRHARPTLN